MRHYNRIVLISLSFVGLIILGAELTGLVISETCCVGETCTKENLCVSGGGTTGMTRLYITAGIMMVALSVVIFLHKKNKKGTINVP